MAKKRERENDVFQDGQDGQQGPVSDASIKAALFQNAGTGTPVKRLQGKAFEIVPWVYDSWAWDSQSGAVVHGNRLITDADIQKVLAVFADKIDKWAYILHDKDVYTLQDEKRNYAHKVGTPKPPHYHIMILLRERQRIGQIAAWFNVPVNQVERKGGKLDGPFIDMVEYMTHRLHPDKAPYDESAIDSNVDVHELLLEVDKKRKLVVKYAKTTEDIQVYCDKIADGSMSLDEVRAEVGGYTFSKNERAFRTNRAYFLEKVCHLPDYRGNYYISGDSGEGKGVLSTDLACSLVGVPRKGMTASGEAISLEDYIFFVSADERGGISFDGYDGQGVIVWEDITGEGVCKALGGVKSTLQALEVHPNHRIKVHVKYGHATLVNAFNIFCGTQPYDEFLRELVGWRKDAYSGAWVENGQPLKQSVRRVPVIINVHPEDYDVLLRNDLTTDCGGNVMQYDIYRRVRGSYARIAQRLDGAAREKYAAMLLPPVIEAVDAAKVAATGRKITDPDADLPEFAGFGAVQSGEDATMWDQIKIQQMEHAERQPIRPVVTGEDV